MKICNNLKHPIHIKMGGKRDTEPEVCGVLKPGEEIIYTDDDLVCVIEEAK